MQSLVDTYNQHVSSGKIQREEEQERLLTKLDALRVIVEQKKRKFLFSKPPLAPRGIYVWGGVGCGKSMIMDMFVDSLSNCWYKAGTFSFLHARGSIFFK